MTRGVVLIALVLLQAACAVFFVGESAVDLLGARSEPISWRTREFMEIGAALGLLLGMGLGWIAFREVWTRGRRAESQLRLASGAFQEVLEERFRDWRLTPAERDVALLSIKGFSTAEIAAARATSEGTVKAQTNAIYRKAGVTGRPQLLTGFIEDLMGEGLALQSKDQAPSRKSVSE
ncbi:helix-turn-helix transcriptional regulator [Pseudoruegeria sp. SHC-113]|uniref:helix-turn-helix transcriptional regulator n=1 Tax=Pseudoruegeria sp. SHC-113 TaxID=2855439 RepID=UPI0021BB8401|nr:helix-turn-helix transcriptional regulator [Pseudoruegeria sp. SHC-113]MCT8161861.1 helix-turn-helix transcriptional regulator [Pseudoruegeria sp. SHC-113]